MSDDVLNDVEAAKGQDDLAALTTAFYHGLLTRGMTAEQAFVLTQVWLAGVMAHHHHGGHQ